MSINFILPISLSGDTVDRFFDPRFNNDKASFLGKGLCDSSMAFTPCSPLNRFRVVKLGSIKSISSLRLRAAPIAMLQRLGLIDQALPISNFYFKVRLCDDIPDSLFQTKIVNLNKSIKDNLFHSYSDGVDSFSLNPSSNKPKHFKRPLLVVDCPPFSIKEEQIREWLSSNWDAKDIVIRWADSPCGTSFVVECSFPSPSTPFEFVFGHKHYKIKYFSILPSDYKFFDSPSLSPDNSLINYFLSSQSSSVFPDYLEDAVLSVLSDSPPSSPSLPVPAFSRPSAPLSPLHLSSSSRSPPPTLSSSTSFPSSSSSPPPPLPSYVMPSYPPPIPTFPYTLNCNSSQPPPSSSSVSSLPSVSPSLLNCVSSIIHAPSSDIQEEKISSKRPTKALLPHQLPGDDDDPSSDYQPTPPDGTSSIGDLNRTWVRPAKRTKNNKKPKLPNSSNISSPPSPSSSDIFSISPIANPSSIPSS